MRLYPRLAWSGIRKNKKLYVPYLLSCIGTVMMYFILHSLSVSPLLNETHGGGNLQIILSLGKYVIAAFSLLFLFYTNSFLIRRRYKEFGLYSILGMDKRSISKVIVCESVTVSVIGLGLGLLFGLAFSKLAELGLLRAIQSDISFRFYISWEAVWQTLALYGGIFLLLLVKSLLQVGRARPLELLRSENFGEKPPKANWVVAILGLFVLGGAYYLSLSIQSPLKALMLFFIAVLMVILATYLLFIAGSVTVCRILQKNRKYYYKKNHFVSVSSMAYRMKRNGAGLASICVLCTMVLVMISSSASLYFGMDDTMKARFPQDNVISLYLPNPESATAENIAEVKATYEQVFEERNLQPENVTDFTLAYIIGTVKDNHILTDGGLEAELSDIDAYCAVYFVPQADYNRITDSNISLERGHAMLYSQGLLLKGDKIEFDELSLTADGTVDVYPIGSNAVLSVGQTCMLVVSDLNELQPLKALKDEYGDSALFVQYYYGYDLDTDEETAVDVIGAQTDAINRISFLNTSEGYSYSGGCRAGEYYDFLTTYGGLFFIGICLSIVFIFAAAMIIYYKQISEGYEDRARFAIMQKVGMTKQDIRRSINSQVLTVFFAPLLMAGLHLGFAVPLVWKILQMFGLMNFSFMILVTVLAFVLFGIFYAVIYKLTAKAYFTIVSTDE